jgi:protein-tyrosine phosphatase
MNKYLTELPFGFPGRIYRSPMPFGAFDPDDTVLDLYGQAGVKVVVMLVSFEEAWQKTGLDLRCLYRDLGMQVIYLPIPDFDIPQAETLLSGLAQVQTQAHAGQTVAVHCNAGVGRTGLFMACLARKVFGMTGERAVAWVQQYIEHAVETESQVSFVENLDLGMAA